MKQKLLSKEVFVNAAKGAVATKGFDGILVPHIVFSAKVIECLGVSKCATATGDSFDEKFGIKLSILRAQIDAKKQQRQELGRLKQELQVVQRQFDAEVRALKEQEDRLLRSIEPAVLKTLD